MRSRETRCLSSASRAGSARCSEEYRSPPRHYLRELLALAHQGPATCLSKGLTEQTIRLSTPTHALSASGSPRIDKRCALAWISSACYDGPTNNESLSSAIAARTPRRFRRACYSRRLYKSEQAGLAGTGRTDVNTAMFTSAHHSGISRPASPLLRCRCVVAPHGADYLKNTARVFVIIHELYIFAPHSRHDDVCRGHNVTPPPLPAAYLGRAKRRRCEGQKRIFKTETTIAKRSSSSIT
ncbi:unnamed protein product [Trichogramma brassicae]|uniref:Uncharacterized protein n=1 Tax=Trichogramma brassicae TaxID=86971 RepID=A0A6H5IZF2_9HYME|nr:unnamed protein product [Trichogramma brassicae]